MISLLGKKLRIYAMLIRLEEIQKERQNRIIILEAPKSKEIKIINKVEPFEYYFKPKKLHPKHQRQNKYRFNK